MAWRAEDEEDEHAPLAHERGELLLARRDVALEVREERGRVAQRGGRAVQLRDLARQRDVLRCEGRKVRWRHESVLDNGMERRGRGAPPRRAC